MSLFIGSAGETPWSTKTTHSYICPDKFQKTDLAVASASFSFRSLLFPNGNRRQSCVTTPSPHLELSWTQYNRIVSLLRKEH